MTKQTGYLVTWDEMSTMNATPVEQTTAPNGDKIVTKSESTDYYSWDEAYLSKYEDNQCPPYEAFVPTVNLVSILFSSQAAGGADCYIDNNGTHSNGVEEWLMGWDRSINSGDLQPENSTFAIFGREGEEFTAKSYVDGRYSTWGDYTGCTTTVQVIANGLLVAQNSQYFTNESRPDATNWRVETEVKFTPTNNYVYQIRTFNHSLVGPPDCNYTATFTEETISETPDTTDKPYYATDYGALLFDIMQVSTNISDYRFINITPDTAQFNNYAILSTTISQRRVPSDAFTIPGTEITGPFAVSRNGEIFFRRFGVNIDLMKSRYPSINIFMFRLVVKRTTGTTNSMTFYVRYGRKINSLVEITPDSGVDFASLFHENNPVVSRFPSSGNVVVNGQDTNTYYSAVKIIFNKTTNEFSFIDETV